MTSETPEKENETEVVEENTPVEASSAPASDVNFDDIKVKMALKGTVKRTELQGAIIDLGLEKDGLLHISQLSTEVVKNVTDVIKEGDEIEVYVLAVDKETKRVDLTLIQMPDVTWDEVKVGSTHTGTVERIEKYGVFVNIGAERPGLIHVSQLAQDYVKDPEDIVKVGDEIEAKVIGVNKRKKLIDLSVRALEEAENQVDVVDEEEEEFATAMEIALRKAMNDDGEFVKKGKGNKKRNKRKSRREQDDIIERTLRFNQD